MDKEYNKELYGPNESSGAVLVNKEYTGLSTTVCTVILDKKPVNSCLKTAQEQSDMSISSDRVIF